MKSTNCIGTIVSQGKYALRNGNFTKRRVYYYISFSCGRTIVKGYKEKQWRVQQIPEGAEILL